MRSLDNPSDPTAQRWHHRRRPLGAIATTVAVTVGIAVSQTGGLAHAGGEGAQVSSGRVQTLAGWPGDDLEGGAVMIRSGGAGGRTIISIHLRGLDPNTTYPVHVHNRPCSFTPPGGGHYQHLVGGAVDATNEVWPTVSTNAHGNGVGFATHDHRARQEAQAIIVHNPANTSIRLACIDLS